MYAFLNFESSIALFTTSITGALTLIGIHLKNKYSQKMKFEKLTKEKLEKIYNPLFLYLSINKNKEFLSSETLENLMKKHGFLLSNKILKRLTELFLKENEIKNSTDPSNVLRKEHDNLKKKIISDVEKEFDDLRDIDNIGFEKEKFNYIQPKILQHLINITNFFIYITIISWSIILLKWLFSKIFPESFTQNIFLDFFLKFYFLVIIVTIIALVIYYFIKVVLNNLNVSKDCYKPGEEIPETGEYKCIICKTKQTFYQYDSFPRCTQETGFFKKILHFIIQEIWFKK